MGSGISLKTTDPVDIPTPSTDKVTIFIDSTNSDTPSYKDELGNVLPLGTTGATGPTGPAGANGAAGPQAIGFVLVEEVPAEDIVLGGGSGGASTPFTGNPWVLVATQVAAGAAVYDFPNLGAYTDIMVVIDDLTRSGATASALQVSTNNGSSFLSSVADYLAITTAGVETGLTGVTFFTTSTASARSGIAIIHAFNVAGCPKIGVSPTSTFPGTIMPGTTALNAVRVTQASGTMPAGTIYVYGRK